MSPITVTFRVPRAAPMPWQKRKARSRSTLPAGEGARAAGETEEKQGWDQDFLASVAVRKDAKDRRHHDSGEGEDGDQKPHLSAGYAQLAHYRWDGRRNARHPEYGHQGYTPKDVKVVVLIDAANVLASLGHGSHEERIYQATRSRMR
jgi:hypothetical protein